MASSRAGALKERLGTWRAIGDAGCAAAASWVALLLSYSGMDTSDVMRGAAGMSLQPASLQSEPCVSSGKRPLHASVLEPTMAWRR